MDESDVANHLSRRMLLAAAGAASVVAASEAGAVDKVPGMPPDLSNFGQCADDKALDAMWSQFCRNLEKAGHRVFKTYNPATPLLRADGFRFLTQNLGQAFDLGFETHDTQYPAIFTFSNPYCKWGGDNADCVYQNAWIDGHSVYKLSGNRGTMRLLNIVVHGPRPDKVPGTTWRSLQDPSGDMPEAHIYGHELVTDWDGNFELYIGGPKRGPNWLPTTAGSRKIFIRQLFDNWSESPATMRIERVGMTEPRPMPMPADIIKGMKWADTFLTTLMTDWPDWAYAYSSGTDPVHLNEFPHERRDVADPTFNAASDKMRGRTIINMTWKLAPDEALIIDFDNTDVFWMLTNMGVFMNSMDFQYRPVSYTPSRTKVDSDGKIRMVLAHKDPGYHNWIDTCGFDMGNITSRNFLGEQFTVFRTKVVKHADLAKEMPADSPKVTREERTQLMLQRFHAIQRRYSI